MHTILSYFAYKILVYNIVSMTSSPIYQKEKKEKKKPHLWFYSLLQS